MSQPSVHKASTMAPVTDPVDPGQLMTVATHVADQGVASGAALVDRIQAVNREMMEFWSVRLAGCWKLYEEFAACRSANDAFPVQQRYLQDLMHAYAALPPRLLGACVGDDDAAGGKSTVDKAVARHARAA